MLYCSWDMVRDRCNCYFWFWAMFCPFTLLTAQKIKISKKWKKCLIILYVYQKLRLDDERFLRFGAQRTDRQMDWWIDGAQPKNSNKYETCFYNCAFLSQFSFCYSKVLKIEKGHHSQISIYLIIFPTAKATKFFVVWAVRRTISGRSVSKMTIIINFRAGTSKSIFQHTLYPHVLSTYLLCDLTMSGALNSCFLSILL